MDGKAPTCDEEAGRGRRLGAEKIVRLWLVRRKEVSRMHRLHHCPCWKVRNIRERLVVAKRNYVRHLKDNGQKPLYSAKMGSRKARELVHSCRRFPEPCCHRWLLVGSGRKGACGSVVQLDHDEDMEPMHGMYGTLEAQLEAQHTIKRAELTALLCLLRKAIFPTVVHVDNKGINGGLWRGEMGCPAPSIGQKDC